MAGGLGSDSDSESSDGSALSMVSFEESLGGFLLSVLSLTESEVVMLMCSSLVYPYLSIALTVIVCLFLLSSFFGSRTIPVYGESEDLNL